MSDYGGELRPSGVGRWDLERIDPTDPLAPAVAQELEARRLIGRVRSQEIGPYAELPDEEIVAALTRDCGIIVAQLRDNPHTKLDPEHIRLAGLVLRLPRTLTQATETRLTQRIITAWGSRHRCMQTLAWADRLGVCLNDLQAALSQVITRFDEPLTPGDAQTAVATVEEMFAGLAHPAPEPPYESYFWAQEMPPEQAAVIEAEAIMQLREPPRTYQHAAIFDPSALHHLRPNELIALEGADNDRVLDIITSFPPTRHLQVALALNRITDPNDIQSLSPEAMNDIIEVASIRLDNCARILEHGGMPTPLDMLFTCAMLDMPPGTPRDTLLAAYYRRELCLQYAAAAREDYYGGDDMEELPPEDAARTNMSAIIAAAGHYAAQSVPGPVRRKDGPHAVRDAEQYLAEQRSRKNDGDDDEGDGDIFIPA